jgi:O-antigen ligase
LLLFIAQRREFFAELLLSLLQSAAFVLLPSSGGVRLTP